MVASLYHTYFRTLPLGSPAAAEEQQLKFPMYNGARTCVQWPFTGLPVFDRREGSRSSDGQRRQLWVNTHRANSYSTVQCVPLFASPRAWSRSSVQGLGNHAIQTLASLRSLTFFSSASGPSLGACLLIGCKWRRNYNSRRELRAGSCSGSRGLDSRHQKPSPSSSSLQVRFKFASRCLRLK